MRGIGDKQAYLLKTLVTINDSVGSTIDAGDTITFPKAFTNIPAATVIPPFGSVDADHQPASVWTATCTTDECVITLESALPDNYLGATFTVGVFVHEQL